MMDTINWTDGSWSDNISDSSLKKIVITGDWAPIRHFETVMADEPEKCYGSTIDVLDAADLRIVNLECAMEGKRRIIKAGPNLPGSRKHIPCLKRGGFEIATLGNNHVFDYGAEGYRNTLGILNELGMKYLGAGMNREEAREPLIYNLDGIKIGLINFTEGHDLSDAGENKPGVFGWHPEAACAMISELKKECDLVFVIVHGGIEYCAYPPGYCIEAYRKLAGEKPDAVIAHHPHVPQGIEIYQGVPIFYSLGNYLFYQETDLAHRKHGYLLELEVSRSGLHGFKIHPYGISDSGVDLLRGEKYQEFLRLVQDISRPFKGNPLDGYHGVLKERWDSGFAKAEFERIGGFFSSDLIKAAALLRDRMSTLQHTGLFFPMFDRVVRGIIDDAPDWAVKMEHEFLNKKI